MRGLGTLLNVAAVLAGASIGVLIGDRLPHRTRDVVTDAVGLVVLMVAVLDGASVLDPALRKAVGGSAPVLIVLGSLLIGGIAGSLLRIEDRLNGIGSVLQRKLTRSGRASVRDVVEGGGIAEGVVEGEIDAAEALTAGSAVPAGSAAAGSAGAGSAAAGLASEEMSQRERFIEGFVSASLVFCVGPLTILGSLQDGLGNGFSQLALKSVLDGFTSIAFAASLGWGVAAAALSVLVIQGSLTAAAAAIGGLIPGAGIAALTATGGLLLAGIALRMLRVRTLPVADMLPALIVAPILTGIVAALR
jgi:uncharacterized membrane protein YqgA involved in biofilm formation